MQLTLEGISSNVSVNRNRETLGIFVSAVKHNTPGNPGFNNTSIIRNRDTAIAQYKRSLNQLKRACLRAGVDFDQVCSEYKLSIFI